MNWLDRLLARSVKRGLEKEREAEREAEIYGNKTMSIGPAMAIEKGRAEGEDRIIFELTSAVGGRILNVRRYDERKDRHDNQTYVIPSGEDVGARVAKIINLELIK